MGLNPNWGNNGFIVWWLVGNNSNNSNGGKEINSNSDKTITLNLKIFKHINLIRDCTTLGLTWDHTGQAIYIADFTIAKRKFKIEGVINRHFFIFLVNGILWQVESAEPWSNHVITQFSIWITVSEIFSAKNYGFW